MKYDRSRKIGKRLLSEGRKGRARRFCVTIALPSSYAELMASPLVPFICILNTISQTLLSCEWRVDEKSRQKKGKKWKIRERRKKGNGALSQATPDKSAFLRFSFLRLIERCFDNHLKTRAESNSLVLADRFLITLFVVEISDSTVDLKEETKKFGRRWAHKSHKKGSRFRWKYRKKVVHLTEAGAEDKQMVRLTRHKVTTQHGNWRKARLLMQNWFHFMALLLQIKMKRRAGKWYCERLWSEVKYYFVPWTFPRFTNLMTTSVV